MSIALLEGVVEELLGDATSLGYVYFVVFTTLRVFPVFSMFGGLFGDELKSFDCAEKTQGCLEMCFNDMVPMSLNRLYSLQLFILCLPTLIWRAVVYNEREKLAKARLYLEEIKKIESESPPEPIPVALSSTMVEMVSNKSYETPLFEKPSSRRDSRESGNLNRTYKKDNTYIHMTKYGRRLEKAKTKTRRNIKSGGTVMVDETTAIHVSHVIQLVSKLALELIFISLVFFRQKLQHNGQKTKGFWEKMKVPQFYYCGGYPDSQYSESHGYFNATKETCQSPHVQCWVMRSWEKTFFLRYMAAMSTLSIIILTLDIIFLCVKGGKRLNKEIIEKKQRKATLQTGLRLSTTSRRTPTLRENNFGI